MYINLEQNIAILVNHSTSNFVVFHPTKKEKQDRHTQKNCRNPFTKETKKGPFEEKRKEERKVIKQMNVG